MSHFITEAALVGAKEAVKLVILWLAVSAYLRSRGAKSHETVFNISIALGLLLVPIVTIVLQGDGLLNWLDNLSGYAFFIFYFASVWAILFSEKSEKFRPSRYWTMPLILVLTLAYIVPDATGSLSYLTEMSEMRESSGPVIWAFGAGFILISLVGYFFLRGRHAFLGGFLGVVELLLLLLVIKILGGGIKGLTEFSLLGTVQSGAMKFTHDFVHQTFVYLMVPDHPLLSFTVWNFIGYFFGDSIGLGVTLFILILPPALYIYRLNTLPLGGEAPADLSASEVRLIKSEELIVRRKRSIPIALFVMVILALWFTGGTDIGMELYNPKARPVVPESGKVFIPMSDPSMDLMDGSLYKFSLLKDGETITLIVIKRPDGKLSVCLDACEICPPDGYGLKEDKVVCIFCGTPIPIMTLGKPGGCNPVPLESTITSKGITISTDEIVRKWHLVTSGQTKGEVKDR